jgi:hypothetical protein
MWEVLEHDLLATFKDKYRDIPKYNTQGKGKGFSVENIARFSKSRLASILERLRH